MAERLLAPADLLTMLAAAPPRIAAATAGLTPVQTATSPADGAWSINAILAHLRACADMWGSAITTILADDHASFRATNPRHWIKHTDYPEQPWMQSFNAYTAKRAQLITTLRALAPPDWQRAATVSVAGKPHQRTVQFYARWLATHERSHLNEIERIAAALRRTMES